MNEILISRCSGYLKDIFSPGLSIEHRASHIQLWYTLALNYYTHSSWKTVFMNSCNEHTVKISAAVCISLLRATFCSRCFVEGLAWSSITWCFVEGLPWSSITCQNRSLLTSPFLSLMIQYRTRANSTCSVFANNWDDKCIYKYK